MRGAGRVRFFVDEQYAHVRYVKAFFAGAKRYYVACAQECFGSFCHARRFDDGETVAAVSDFCLLDFCECGGVGEGRVELAVGRHEVDGLDFVCGEVASARHFLKVAAVGVVDNPVAYVVKPGGVIFLLAATVAQPFEIVGEIAP